VLLLLLLLPLLLVRGEDDEGDDTPPFPFHSAPTAEGDIYEPTAPGAAAAAAATGAAEGKITKRMPSRKERLRSPTGK
jgi:hypothetical protein